MCAHIAITHGIAHIAIAHIAITHGIAHIAITQGIAHHCDSGGAHGEERSETTLTSYTDVTLLAATHNARSVAPPAPSPANTIPATQ